MTTGTLPGRRRPHRLGSRPRLAIGLVVASMLSCLLGFDQSASAGPTSSAADEQHAVELLTRAADADATVSYRGSQIVTVFDGDNSVTALVELVHVAGSGTTVQPAVSAYRPVTSTYVPVADTVSNLGRESLRALVDAYQVSVASKPSWPVGRRAHVVVARSPDGRIAARFWLDDATGLMLRRQLYRGDGSLARTSAFTDLRLRDVSGLSNERKTGTDVLAAAVAPGGASEPAPSGPVSGTTTAEAETAISAAQARAAGWQTPKHLIPGSRLVALSDADNGTVLHLIYTDGVTTVSVFQQKGRLDPSELDATPTTVAGRKVWLHIGLPSYAAWSCDGITYTVVGDTADELPAAVQALPHDPDHRAGLLGRIGRGMHRLYGLIDPLA